MTLSPISTSERKCHKARCGCLCLVFLAPFIFEGGLQRAPAQVIRVITDAENGSSISLTVGQILEVRLETQYNGGYLWYLSSPPNDHLRVLEDTHSGYEGPGFGGPAKQIFRVKAMTRGKATFRVVSQRSWERDKPPKLVYEVKVFVR